MKELLKTKLLFLLGLGVFSCIGEDEYAVPTVSGTAIDIPSEQLITIGALQSLWLQETDGEGTYTFGEDYRDLYMEGYVVSSDEMGNYFEELFLQDRPENPVNGIRFLIDVNPLFSRFPIGRRVYVHLVGLSIGLQSGVLSLGRENANTVAPISEALMDTQILRDTLQPTLIPKSRTISSLSEADIGVWLRLEEVQFYRNQLFGDHIYTYAGETDDTFDGERILESCTDYNRVVFSTSTFADFKSHSLAIGSGHIDGILQKDYYGEYLIFSVNALSDIQLNNEIRCDPEVFDCRGEINGTTLVWSENFEDVGAMVDLELEGWENIQVNGTTSWNLNTFGGNTYLEITGYNSGDDEIDSWLVTPMIDLDQSTAETLELLVQSSYDNGATLEILCAQNYTGNITTATWLPLDVLIPIGPSDGFGEFMEVGEVSLDCLEGGIHLAFRYRGSDPEQTTRFHIDVIELFGIK